MSYILMRHRHIGRKQSVRSIRPL